MIFSVRIREISVIRVLKKRSLKVFFENLDFTKAGETFSVSFVQIVS